MKNIKIFALVALLMTTIGGTVIVTSCSKSSCSGLVCQNGGSCSSGKCSCPAGFSGTFCQFHANTAIQYVNNTFTPITISVNGVIQTIVANGGTVAFKGASGSAATGSASTSGTASSLGISTDGGVIGLPINWSINNIFPNTDTLRVPLDVGATYFFLRMINNRSTNIINFYVNVDFPYGNFYQDVTVPNSGNTYDLGYYLAYPGGNVQAQTSDSKVIWMPVNLPQPFGSNQVYTVTIN